MGWTQTLERWRLASSCSKNRRAVNLKVRLWHRQNHLRTESHPGAQIAVHSNNRRHTSFASVFVYQNRLTQQQSG